MHIHIYKHICREQKNMLYYNVSIQEAKSTMWETLEVKWSSFFKICLIGRRSDSSKNVSKI